MVEVILNPYTCQWVISKIYKPLQQINKEKTDCPIWKKVKDLNRPLKTEDIMWLMNIWKAAHSYYSSGKYLLKPQCDKTTHTPE